MTRESKLALMIAVTLVLLVGVLVSDHLSGARVAEFDAPVQPAPSPVASLPGAERAAEIPFPEPQRTAQSEATAPVVPFDSEPVEIHQGPALADAGERSLIHRALEGVDDALGRVDWAGAPALVAQQPQRAAPEERAPTLHDLFVPVDPGRVTIAAVPSNPSGPVKPVAEPKANTRTETKPEPRSASAAAWRTHTVAEGDSLYRLAAHYLGDGNRWTELRKLNADVLGDSDTLLVGMVLKIAPERSAAAAPRSEPAAAPAVTRTYVVLKGDSLGRIAQKLLGSSKRTDEIVKLNNLKDPDDIRVGQTLKIPAK